MDRSLRQILAAIVFANLVLQPVSVVAAPQKQQTQVPLYTQIKELYLPAMGMLAVEEKPEQPVVTVLSSDKKDEKPDLIIKPLTEAQKKTIAFDLLARNDKSTQNPGIARHSWLDMELFENANLADVINRTRTNIGEAALAKMLVADRGIDSKISQDAVKELVNNEQLRNNLDGLLKVFAHTEDIFLKTYQAEDPALEKYFEQAYCGSMLKKLGVNESPVALESINRLNNIYQAGRVCGVNLLTTAIAALEVKVMSQAMGFPLSPKVGAMLSFQPFVVLSGLRVFLGDNAPLKLLGLDSQNPLFNRFFQDNAATIKMGALAFMGLAGFGWWIDGKQGYDLLKTHHDITKHLQTKLIHASGAMRSVFECHSQCASAPVLRTAIPELDAIKSFFAKAPEKLQRLINLLNTETFKGSASFWSHHGRTLVAYQLMRELKYELRDAIEAMGVVDAYLSVAKLYKEFEGSQTPYCFVEFSEQSTPYINAINFWNPQVDPKKAVPNSLELGRAGGNRNMILTGQNTAGKSTALRALLHCTLLGQVFGIAPAQAMVMTPFKSIFTHIIVKDDTVNGVSLYKAEVNQVRDMQTTIRPLRRNEFCLVVIDEIFRSTGEQQAVILAHDCATWLAQYPNVMVIQSTHKPELIKLEQETKGLFKNFKMEIIKQQDGSLYRPHKIEEGSTTANVAAEILAEEGVDFSR